MLNIIVAIDENNAIGRQGELLCHLPADLQHFKAITTGHTVLMGERTWLSLPHRPLPHRRNIVLTDRVGETFDGAITVYDLQEALRLANEEEEAFVIGGGMVYRQCIAWAYRLYITHIHHIWHDADTFFPEILPSCWSEVKREEFAADDNNPYDFSFVTYERKKA